MNDDKPQGFDAPTPPAEPGGVTVDEALTMDEVRAELREAGLTDDDMTGMSRRIKALVTVCVKLRTVTDERDLARRELAEMRKRVRELEEDAEDRRLEAMEEYDT